MRASWGAGSHKPRSAGRVGVLCHESSAPYFGSFQENGSHAGRLAEHLPPGCCSQTCDWTAGEVFSSTGRAARRATVVVSNSSNDTKVHLLFECHSMAEPPWKKSGQQK